MLKICSERQRNGGKIHTSHTDKGERCREEEQRHVGQRVDRDDAHRQLRDRHDPAYQARGAVRSPREQRLAEDVAAAR